MKSEFLHRGSPILVLALLGACRTTGVQDPGAQGPALVASESQPARPAPRRASAPRSQGEEEPYNPLFPVEDYSGDIATRSHLSGDWGGTRTEMAAQGVLVDFDTLVTGQAVIDGGDHKDGKIQLSNELLLRFDSELLGLYSGGYLAFRTEARLGDSVIDDAGSVASVSHSAVTPADNFDEDIIDITELRYTHVIDDRWQVYGGLLQTLDLDHNPFASGRGRTQFMNSALVQSPVIYRGVPYSTLGLGGTFQPNEMLRVSATIMDTEESSGNDPFDTDDGATYNAELHLTYDFNGLPGGDMLGYVYADSEFPRLDKERVLLPPGSTAQDRSTWALYYNFYQYVMVLEEGPQPKGWGVFGRLGYGKDETNPIQWMASFGLGGEGFLFERPQDSFGVGYYYLGVADEAIIRALDVDDEQGLEIFYNFQITPFLRVTPDIQFIDSGNPGADDAWVVALRTQLRV